MLLKRKILARGVLVAAAALLSGCAVSQPPGNGEVLHLQEPTTNGWYWLYLPEDYVHSDHDGLTNKQWPLVVTFHGMKPFDTASRQIREWQQEADRYGFVVIAPELTSPDLIQQFPLRTVHPGVKRDEALTTAAMDQVTRRVDIDPTKVLSTSWSSGGYLAHYMANRHPERFSCIGVRQSNFSSAVLDPETVSRYRQDKVGIFNTENDIAVCMRESKEAAQWYNRHGFDVTVGVFKGLGHERRPGVAAAFFARTCGVDAKTPPTEIAQMQVVDQPPLAAAAAEQPAQPEPSVEESPPQTVADAVRSRSKRRPGVATQSDEAVSMRRPEVAFNAPSSESSELPRAPAPVAQPAAGTESPPEAVRIRVNTAIGIAPLLVRFSAIVPADLRDGGYFLWLNDDQPISNALNGQTYLDTAGRHRLELVFTTADGQQYRAIRSITVLERIAPSDGETPTSTDGG